jgi:hypothetical protein
MARKLARIIKKVDKIAFPDNPIKKIKIIHRSRRKNEKGTCLNYVREEEGDSLVGEYYELFVPDLREAIEQQKKEKIHLLLVKKKKGKWINILFCTEEEIILAMAVHEVRHRLQRLFHVRLFSIKNGKQIPSLKNLINLLERNFGIELPETSYAKEFDVKVIEHIVISGWRQGKRKPSDLRKAIRAEPKSFKRA